MVEKSKFEQKLTNENLIGSEQRYQLLIENIPSVAWITASDGKTIFISDNVKQVYGYTADEILSGGSELWFDRIHPDDKARVQEEFELLFTEQKNYKIEYRIKRKDGEWIWLLDSANMVEDVDGQLLAYGVFSDITDRKQVEEALQESEDRIRRLSEASFEGIAITEKGIIVDANMRFAEMLGYTLEEMIGKQAVDLAAPESRDLVQERVMSEYEAPYEAKGLRKDKSTFFAEMQGKAISYKGRVARVTAVRDITERKQVDEAYRILVESSLQALVILQDNRIVFTNSAAEDLSGYSIQELLEIENIIQTIIHPDDVPAVLEREARRTRGEQVNPRAVYRYVRKDGSTFWAESYTKLIEWRGKPAIHTVFIDITDRMKAEDELKRISQEEIKRREELEKLRKISANMRKAEGSTSLLKVVTQEIQELCRADVASSILFKNPQSVITFLSPEAAFELSQEQSEAIRKALLNAKTGELTTKIPGFETVLILQLQSSETTHGAVIVASQKPEPFSADVQNMLNPVADMTGTALHRIDIWETLEERVKQRTHDLIVLYNLITIISENWLLQDLLELSLVLTLETVKADRGIIYLLDEGSTTDLRPVIQRGFADDFQVVVDNLPDDELAREALNQQKAFSIDIMEDERFSGLGSYVGIPIKARGTIRGVFSLFANEKDAFSPEKMALLGSIADHLGIGIENSILYEKSRESAALEERNRLARDLHDSVSQLLYSLTLMTGTTKKMIERGSDMDAVKSSIDRLGDTAHRALQEMRLLLFELRPAVLDSEGLISALQHRIKSVEESLGVKVDLQVDGLPELPSDVEDALYHIALESLNNITKHSGSKTASIRITSHDGTLSMEIADQGRGFDTDLLQRGLGLRNMRERGQMLGSEVVVVSKPGEGTRVTVVVELPS